MHVSVCDDSKPESSAEETLLGIIRYASTHKINLIVTFNAEQNDRLLVIDPHAPGFDKLTPETVNQIVPSQ